jgi:hypothetical protein
LQLLSAPGTLTLISVLQPIFIAAIAATDIHLVGVQRCRAVVAVIRTVCRKRAENVIFI